MTADVSVIIPVYNSEKTITKALDGLVNQTFNNFEVICVDDGSKDNSLKILKEYSAKYPFIKVFSQENSGPAKARNYAISQSKGKYLMFCDADDWNEPEMIEEMFKAIEEQNTDIVMCGCNVIDLSNATVHSEKDIKWCRLRFKGFHKLIPYKKVRVNCVLWNKIFKKELMEKYDITYPTEYEHDDTRFFWKYIFACSTYYGLDKKLYNYVLGNPESVSGKYRVPKYNPHQYDFIFILQEIFDFIKNTELKNDYENYFQYTIRSIRFFYKNLEPSAKDGAFKHLKELVNRNIDFLKYFDEDYIYIHRISRIKDFDDFIFNGIKKEINPIFKFIYSVEYIDFVRIQTIFGIIKIKKKNKELAKKYKFKKSPPPPKNPQCV